MGLMLGIDTGGTFTDAVLVDAGTNEVVAHAKAETTHHDLAVGVAGAVAGVLGQDRSTATAVVVVSMSTTLATNALVEGHGEPAGLLAFGFSRRELDRTGVSAAVDPDMLCIFDGGHDAHGNERSPLGLAAVERAATLLAPRVSAFAVAAQFSVRNPDHEIRAAKVVRTVTGKPVTASHELSAKLDGPRRALTAALNARLLGTIDRLNVAVQSVLASHGVEAPVMVVRGDGSLVSAAFASTRPIETILSGPAASVVGAVHLAGVADGLVVDIGGTTTDVAAVVGGRPSIAGGGAVVGGHRTMVEAVAMTTIGLGGDSEVRIDTRANNGPLVLGPERAIPMCRLALQHPELHAVLDRQLAAPLGLITHGRFLVAVAPPEVRLSDERERAVLARLRSGPLTAADAAPTSLAMRAARRLQARGLIRVATMTPTDASAMTGSIDGVDTEASAKTATILARQTGPGGGPIASGPVELAERVIERLVHASADGVLRAALGSDGVATTMGDPLLGASLRGHRGAATVAVGLSKPLTAIGAAAATYYQQVAGLAGTHAVIPSHASVANAIGAVVGHVSVRRSATITQPTRGQYRVHLENQPTFGSVANARAHASELLTAAATADAEAAGAATPELAQVWDERTATVDGRDVFVEGTLTVEATGRPRL